MEHFFILLGAGMAGGFINAIAGGGGIVMYPVLLASGLPPLIANATASLVVVPGSITAALGYKKELKRIPRSYLWLVVPTVIGSFVGSVILTRTASHTFEDLAPWLILSAVILLATQSRLHHWLHKETKKRKIKWRTMPFIYTVLFPLSIYAGFFGPGFGLMMLALLGFSSLKNIHQMNGVKSFCSIFMAVVSTSYFLHKGLVDLPSGMMMGLGTALGGTIGTRFAHRISSQLVHNLTVLIGFVIVIALFVT